METALETPLNNFGWAIELLRKGFKVRRNGWYKGRYLVVHYPDSFSKYQHPAIFLEWRRHDLELIQIDWLALDSDLLAEDWVMFTQEGSG